MRYFLELSYKGTAYNGWQIQNNAPSIQGEVQNALSKILRHPTQVVGAGRTDTGVHALHYVAHFDSVAMIEDSDAFLFHLNSVLPFDIAAKGLRQVRNNAHARFDAILRTYTYVITPLKNPFNRETSWQYYRSLDIEAMNKAAEFFLEYRDFTSFAKLNSANKTNICKVDRAYWEISSRGELHFIISADRFLRNMVRAIVGTLVEVGRGKRSIENVKEIIEARDISKCTGAAPAQGLFLLDVQYPIDIYL